LAASVRISGEPSAIPQNLPPMHGNIIFELYSVMRFQWHQYR